MAIDGANTQEPPPKASKASSVTSLTFSIKES